MEVFSHSPSHFSFAPPHDRLLEFPPISFTISSDIWNEIKILLSDAFAAISKNAGNIVRVNKEQAEGGGYAFDRECCCYCSETLALLVPSYARQWDWKLKQHSFLGYWKGCEHVVEQKKNDKCTSMMMTDDDDDDAIVAGEDVGWQPIPVTDYCL